MKLMSLMAGTTCKGYNIATSLMRKLEVVPGVPLESHNIIEPQFNKVIAGYMDCI